MARINCYVWTSCMDKDTCSACQGMDGKEWKRKKDIAPTPHPGCTSLEGCRCQIVAVFEDEGKVTTGG